MATPCFVSGVTSTSLLQQCCDTSVILPCRDKNSRIHPVQPLSPFLSFLLQTFKRFTFGSKGNQAAVCGSEMCLHLHLVWQMGSVHPLGAFPVYLQLHFHTDDKSTICLQSDNKHQGFDGSCKVSPLSTQQLHQSKQTASPGLEKES